MSRPLNIKLIFGILIASFIATAVLHSAFMGSMIESSGTCDAAAVQAQNCGQQKTHSELCCSLEQSAIQNSLQTSYQLMKVFTLPASVFIGIPLLFMLLLYELIIFSALRTWLRAFLAKVDGLHRHIGFWLRLTEKRDPEGAMKWCAFAYARA